MNSATLDSGNPHTHSEPGRLWTGVVLLVVSAVVLLFTLRLSGQWNFSCIGDEWAVFEHARFIASGQSDLLGKVFGPLSAGTYAVHKPFLSFCQGMVMRLFGSDNFGWRMSGISSLILSIPPLFIIARALLSWRAACLCVALMAFSHYLLIESLWGYGWTFLRLFSLWAVASLVMFLKRPSAPAALCLGVFMSACSLSGALSAYVPPMILAVLAMVFVRKRSTSTRVFIAFAILVFLGTSTIPARIYARPDDLTTSLRLTLWKTNLGPILQHYFGREAFPLAEGDTNTLPKLTRDIAEKIGNTLIAPVTFEGSSHFVFGRVVDPLMGSLAMLGLGLAIVRSIKQPKWMVVLLFFGPAVVLSGGLSPYHGLPVTRLHFLVPFWALFGATAYDSLSRKSPRILGALLFVALTTTSLAWSFNRLFVQLPNNPGYTKQARAIQIIQAFPDRKISLLFSDLHPIDMMLQPYRLNDRVTFGGMRNSDTLLQSLSQTPDALVVIGPDGVAGAPEKVRNVLCSPLTVASSSICDCKPCGGASGAMFTVCGSFECPLPSRLTN